MINVDKVAVDHGSHLLMLLFDWMALEIQLDEEIRQLVSWPVSTNYPYHVFYKSEQLNDIS